MTSKLVSEWNCLDRWKKGMTELARCCDVIPKFSNAWDPRHSLLCRVSTLWTLRAPLTSALPVTHWFSPDRFSKFNSLFPHPLLRPSAPALSGKRQAFYSFTSRRHTWYHLPIGLYWRQTDVGYGTRRGRNNRPVYRRAGRVYSRFSLACFL